LPIIASGGAGTSADFGDVFEAAGSDAALAASLFHYAELAIVDVKQAVAARGIPMRIESAAVR
jgi:imidazole glycerol-phosphate synthase subunit HisF